MRILEPRSAGRRLHLCVKAQIRAGLRRPVALPDGRKVGAALDDEDAARATILSRFDEGYVIEE